MPASFKQVMFATVVLLSGWATPAPGRDAVIGYSGRTIAEMPFAWASRKGFFKESNLDVKLIYMSTSIAAKGLMSGDVDYLMRIVVPDIDGYDVVYKRLIATVAFLDVSASFALETIKYTTALPLTYVKLD